MGLTLESDLTWNIHLNKVIQHANLKLSILIRVKDLCRQTLDMLYKMHVRSILDYALPVYGPALDQNQIGRLPSLKKFNALQLEL